MIAGDLVVWRADGKYNLEKGQFRYCCSEGHLGEVIVDHGFSEKSLHDFLNTHINDKKEKQYYIRVAPKVWKGRIIAAPLPVGEQILAKNVLYNNMKRERPAFPYLNRITGLNLIQQYRRLFQIRFLIHLGFSRTAMNKDTLYDIENNFIEIFLPRCDENTKHLYETQYSYLHTSDSGDLLYDKYMSMFQKPPLYGCIDNIHRITEWNFSELESTLQPFEAIVKNLLGFKFNTVAAKYTKVTDFSNPTWRIGRMVNGSDSSDPNWEECDDSAPFLFDAFLTDLRELVHDPKIKNHSNEMSLYNYSTITKYVRFLCNRDKKNGTNIRGSQVDNTAYEKLVKSHKRLLNLIFCGNEETSFFKKPTIETVIERAEYLATFVDRNQNINDMIYEISAVSEVTDNQRSDLVNAIHDNTMGRVVEYDM
jgi:hypothetical protein